jgi:carbonic anhydrase
VKDVLDKYRVGMQQVPAQYQVEALCELNVIEQVCNVALTTVVQDAWSRGQDLNLHGWVYGLSDGLLKDLYMTLTRGDDLEALRQEAVQNVWKRWASPPASQG